MRRTAAAVLTAGLLLAAGCADAAPLVDSEHLAEAREALAAGGDGAIVVDLTAVDRRLGGSDVTSSSPRREQQRYLRRLTSEARWAVPDSLTVYRDGPRLFPGDVEWFTVPLTGTARLVKLGPDADLDALIRQHEAEGLVAEEVDGALVLRDPSATGVVDGRVVAELAVVESRRLLLLRPQQADLDALTGAGESMADAGEYDHLLEDSVGVEQAYLTTGESACGLTDLRRRSEVIPPGALVGFGEAVVLRRGSDDSVEVRLSFPGEPDAERDREVRREYVETYWEGRLRGLEVTRDGTVTTLAVTTDGALVSTSLAVGEAPYLVCATDG